VRVCCGLTARLLRSLLILISGRVFSQLSSSQCHEGGLHRVSPRSPGRTRVSPHRSCTRRPFLRNHHAGFLGQIENTTEGAYCAAKPKYSNSAIRQWWRHFVLATFTLARDAVFLRAALEGLNAADIQPQPRHRT